MHVEAQISDGVHTPSSTVKYFSWSSVFILIKKWIVLASKEVRLFYIISYVVYAVFTFLISLTVEIQEKKLALNLLIPFAMVYIVGTYLTPLPYYIVIPLVIAVKFIPMEGVMAFFGLTILYSFFHAIII